MSLLALVLIGLLIWLVALMAITLVFVMGTRDRRRGDEAEEVPANRMSDRRVGGDRRIGRDRRIGLPDPRPLRVERRRVPDRRGHGNRGITA